MNVKNIFIISVMAIILLSVLITGLATSTPMVGDEVTHYYLLKKQAADLTTPNFTSLIPTAYGHEDIRILPHVIGWHYLGALVYKVIPSYVSVQIFHFLFFFQLLVASYFLVKDILPSSRSVFFYIILIVSCPMVTLFSITFYQGLPMTAQLVTAFCLLVRKRPVQSSLFMALGLLMKENAILFLPWYIFGVLYVVWKSKNTKVRKVASLLTTATVVLATIVVLELTLFHHTEHHYNPVGNVIQRVTAMQNAKKIATSTAPRTSAASDTAKTATTPHRTPHITFNHPGDVRRSINWLIYPGALFWVMLLFAAFFVIKKRGQCNSSRTVWMLSLVGILYSLCANYLLGKERRDFRYFIPAIPFIFIPIVYFAAPILNFKWVARILIILCVLQVGAALAKTYSLRHISPQQQEVITFLKNNKIPGNYIFMYPEGNYRLFPYQHIWYLSLDVKAMHQHRNGILHNMPTLSEFWQSPPENILQALEKRGIGALVIKKHLIRDLPLDTTNMGIYPLEFTSNLDNYPFLTKKFSNSYADIYYLNLKAHP